MTALLTLERLGIAFGGVQALADVDMAVPAGGITSVIGPNGAGKTTLFNLISGVYRPTSGRVVFDGTDLAAIPTHRLARLGIGRTFQNLALFRQETVIENILVGCHTRMQSGVVAAMLRLPASRRAEAAARAHAEELLEFLDLAPLRDALVGNLAYGVQKRVELGRALATRPRLLLVDELVSGMNPEETAEIARLVLHINREFGITLLMIEHDMGIVMDISDQVFVLNFGRRIAGGTPAEVAGDQAVIDAYLGAA